MAQSVPDILHIPAGISVLGCSSFHHPLPLSTKKLLLKPPCSNHLTKQSSLRQWIGADLLRGHRQWPSRRPRASLPASKQQEWACAAVSCTSTFCVWNAGYEGSPMMGCFVSQILERAQQQSCYRTLCVIEQGEVRTHPSAMLTETWRVWHGISLE